MDVRDGVCVGDGDAGIGERAEESEPVVARNGPRAVARGRSPWRALVSAR